jgi:hypothetical protein
MNLDRVTITGADDSVTPDDLLALARKYPFVEWGILLSRSQEGSPRFPTLAWMERLVRANASGELALCGHLCGAWVRYLCEGVNEFTRSRPSIAYGFTRVQLNFHAEPHRVSPAGLTNALQLWGREQYILQFDEVNDGIMSVLRGAGIDAVPLFDTSGGAGIEPSNWPAPNGEYSGYAGGLHPDWLGAQMARIAEAAGDARIWIDVETHVRSSDDKSLDLAKVERFLAVAQKFVRAR